MTIIEVLQDRTGGGGGGVGSSKGKINVTFEYKEWRIMTSLL